MSNLTLYGLKKDKHTQKQHFFDIRNFFYQCELERVKLSRCKSVKQDGSLEIIFHELLFSVLNAICYCNNFKICEKCIPY